jgi:hypothetical protein
MTAIESVQGTIVEGVHLRQRNSELLAAHQDAVQRLTDRIREVYAASSREICNARGQAGKGASSL